MNEGTSFTRKFPWLSTKARVSELEAFLDSLPQPALLFDTQSWLITHANPQILEATGYTRDELIGTEALSLFADWGEVSAAQPSAGQPELKELVHRDQTQTLFRLHTAPVKNAEKFSMLVLELAETQLTGQKRGSQSTFWLSLNSLFSAENELDLQTALGTALTAAAELSAADLLTVYRLSEGSPEIQRLTGYGEDSILPALLSMQDLIPLNQPQVWKTGKFPSSILHRTARAAKVRYLASAPIGQKTAIVGLVVIGGLRSTPSPSILEIVRLLATVIEAIFRNHIQHENLQKELGEQALQTNRLATVANRVQEGVVHLSPELVIRSLNPRMEQSLGYTSREVAGQTADKILIGNDQILPALVKAQKGESAFHLEDVSLYRRDGESFQALVRVFPVFHKKQVDEILIFIQDLSEVEQIRVRSQELENRALLGELMAVFAHEVRNPINNISTSLQLMAMNLPGDSPQQVPISRMLQDCDRLEELIKSVLAFSKPQEYEMERLELGPLLQRLVDRLRPRIANLKIQTDLQVEPGCPPISGNARALEQVFNNLMNNAVQAMGEKGGLLSLKVQSVPSEEGIAMVEVCVADNGPGIPKEIQERIFQPFFTTKQSGTGLGLSIAKRILTAHKGNIRLSSFPGGLFSRSSCQPAKTI